MDKRRISVLSMVLYGIAGILIAYTIWSMSHSVSYISEMVSRGQLTVKGNEYDIVNFYMSNSGQYPLFALILFALGWIIQKISNCKLIRLNAESNKSSYNEGQEKKADEEDFEDWFQNNTK